jgi:hypothetical protein
MEKGLMPKTHTVRPAEHIAGIAARCGCADFRVTWHQSADKTNRSRIPAILTAKQDDLGGLDDPARHLGM